MDTFIKYYLTLQRFFDLRESSSFTALMFRAMYPGFAVIFCFKPFRNYSFFCFAFLYLID